MTVDLNFSKALPSWDALDLPLRFGEDLIDRPITINAVLPPLVSTLRVGIGVRATISATLGQLVGSIGVDNDINVWRGIAASVGGDWHEASDTRRPVGAAWDQTAPARVARRAPWQQGAGLHRSHGEAIKPLPVRRQRLRSTWEQGAAVERRTGSRFAWLPRRDGWAVDRWGDLAVLGTHAGSRYTHPPSLRDARDLPWGDLDDLAIAIGSDFDLLGRRIRLRYLHPWEEARQPPPGRSIWVPPVDPVPEPYIGDTDLIFCWPAVEKGPNGWQLVFGLPTCPLPGGGTVVVPIRRVYIVQNTASLVRVGDGANIPAQQLSLAIDVDSWAWELRATIVGRSALALLQNTSGEPVEVEATINGYTWRALIDAWSESRAFGSNSFTVTGRSEAAGLGRPYAIARDYAEANTRTAQQLIEQELLIGWTQNFQMTDWLVPAGAWSYQRLTPMEAIARIAAAAGGYVQASRNSQVLRVSPRYPVAPWLWSGETPDLSLPLDAVAELGNEWQPRDEANGIYVCGEANGVLALVRRDGSAGNLQLPMVVDPLISEVAAARQRGIAELGQSGRLSMQRLQIPLSSTMAGLVDTGRLIEVTGDGAAWRGLVRGVSITAGRQQGGLSVRQELTVERHY